VNLVRQKNLSLFVLLALALLAIESWIATSAHLAQNPDVLALAVTVDLTIGIPALYYLLVVRLKRVPLITVAPVFLLSLLAARFILPPSNHFYLNQVEGVVPLVELAALLYLASRVRTIARYYPQARRETPYFLDALETSMRRALGDFPAVPIAAAELSMLYYGTVGWFKEYRGAGTEENAYSYHRKSGYGIILAVIAFTLVLETLAVHLLVQHWSDALAWVLTVLSLYSLLWLLADYHAIRLQPIILTRDVLHLRAGLRWRAAIPLSIVAEVRPVTPADLKGDDYLNLAIFGEPRLLLGLSEPVTVTGPLGIQKRASRLGITVDDEKRFREEVGRTMVLPE
jgi:hypothetical protein